MEEERTLVDRVIHGDALAELRKLADNSADAVITDPPAGIHFMGMDFDHDKGGRDQWIAWLGEVMAEVWRVLKPGAHGVVWSLPRTSHWTALALEKAGFEIRDCNYNLLPGDTKLQTFLASLDEEQRAAFMHLVESQSSPFLLACFGSGFPKSLNISAAIDRLKGMEREVIGVKPGHENFIGRMPTVKGWDRPWMQDPDAIERYHALTAPATPESAKYDGWHTNLKPAVEVWWLVRKPLSEGSVAANVLRWGTGGINVDATRVGSEVLQNGGMSSLGVMHDDGWKPTKKGKTTVKGRWPAHLILSHSLWCVYKGTKRVPGNRWGKNTPRNNQNTQGASFNLPAHISYGYEEEDGYEEVEDWECAEDCPVRIMDEQSGIRKNGGQNYKTSVRHNSMFGNADTSLTHYAGDQGGASRFFTQIRPDIPWLYGSKPGKKERNAGCEGLPEERVARMGHGHDEPDGRTQSFISAPQANTHPTVKSLSLLRHFCRLLCPPGGLVIDPFLGSGTTAVACIQEGCHCLGIEQNANYCEIARSRITHAQKEQGNQ